MISVAREIHDTLAQTFTGITLQLNNAHTTQLLMPRSPGTLLSKSKSWRGLDLPNLVV
ncbi:histidine kinase [Nostoc sp.]|uniref:histidine kinase n=1 Tax=Nostoc sp. TaxID=1180 RepID=UPI002FFD416D